MNLADYVQHHDYCDKWLGDEMFSGRQPILSPTRPCTCGLEAALAVETNRPVTAADAFVSLEKRVAQIERTVSWLTAISDPSRR